MADPIRGIQLVGAPGSLPPDLAARAQQAALAQQIASQLLMSSMEQSPAVIHTGGSNPFARDVPNFAPLGKIVQSYMGSKNLAGASGDLANLAAAGEARRQSDQLEAQAPVETATPVTRTPGNGYDITRSPPSSKDLALSLMLSSHPANQAMGSAIMERQFANEDKQTLTPGEFSNLTSTRGGNFRAGDISRATRRLPWTGAPTLDVTAGESLGKVPETKVLSPTDRVQFTTPAAGTSTPPTTGSGERKPEDIKAAEAAVTHWLDPREGVLPEGFGKVRAFQFMAPVIGNMLKLTEGVTTGSVSAQWIQDARSLAAQAGLVSPETVNKIVDFQTMMKYALVPAIQTARSLTSRPSQMEFMKTLEAAAADPTIRPEAARNIFRNFLVTGLNETSGHIKNLNQAGQNSSVAPHVGQYAFPEYAKGVPLTPEDIQKNPNYPQPTGEEKILAQIGAQTHQNLNFTKSPEGVWHDEGVTTHGTATSAKKAVEKRPIFVDKKGNRAYKNPDGTYEEIQ